MKAIETKLIKGVNDLITTKNGTELTINDIEQIRQHLNQYDADLKEEQPIIINKGWHKNGASYAMTYKQLKFIEEIETGTLEGFKFDSNHQAMRSLTKHDASEIIDGLLADKKVIIQ